MTQQWEYHVQVEAMAHLNSSQATWLIEDLNRKGIDGWELVGVMQPVACVRGVWEYRLIFKRPKGKVR